jgi:transglutaminase-like putative cysteine protease
MILVKKNHTRIAAMLLSLLLIVLFAIPARATQQETQYELLQSMTTVAFSGKLRASGANPDDTQEYVETTEEMAERLRQGLKNRETEIVIPIATTRTDMELVYEVMDAALAHTGDPTEGDYLRWHLGKMQLGHGDGYGVGDLWYYPLIYRPEYYTTAQQEAQLDLAVDTLLDQLDVYDAGDYEKVCAIYDYICRNVTYDYEGLAAGSDLIYTAYAALINGTSVCQGYANLFYRLALELDVDARLIPGIGNGEDHGWNIVKLDGKYYNLDATWDANYAQAGRDYKYFLRSQDNFPDHTRDGEYSTEVFYSAYPMGAGDYVPATGPVPGDIDGDRKVARADVIRLLLHVTLPDRYPIAANADFNGDNGVTRADVILLLLHVTLPDRYPLT